jgi:hypothetical protein
MRFLRIIDVIFSGSSVAPITATDSGLKNFSKVMIYALILHDGEKNIKSFHVNFLL